LLTAGHAWDRRVFVSQKRNGIDSLSRIRSIAVCAINVVVQRHPISDAVSLIAVMGRWPCCPVLARIHRRRTVIVYAAPSWCCSSSSSCCSMRGKTKAGRSFVASLLGVRCSWAAGAAAFFHCAHLPRDTEVHSAASARHGAVGWPRLFTLICAV